MITADITFIDRNKIGVFDIPISGDIKKALEKLLKKYNKNNEVAVIGVHDDRFKQYSNLVARYLSETTWKEIMNTIGTGHKPGIHVCESGSVM